LRPFRIVLPVVGAESPPRRFDVVAEHVSDGFEGVRLLD
jgi:hypothetical protein